MLLLFYNAHYKAAPWNFVPPGPKCSRCWAVVLEHRQKTRYAKCGWKLAGKQNVDSCWAQYNEQILCKYIPMEWLLLFWEKPWKPLLELAWERCTGARGKGGSETGWVVGAAANPPCNTHPWAADPAYPASAMNRRVCLSVPCKVFQRHQTWSFVTSQCFCLIQGAVSLFFLVERGIVSFP